MVDTIPKLPSDRKFGFLFSVVFGLIAAWRFLHGHAEIYIWVVISILFLLAALTRPTILNPLNRLWMKFAYFLNRFVSPIIMALLFFVLITPFGMVEKLLRRDPLRMKMEPKIQSYWITKPRQNYSVSQLKKQY